MRHALACFDLVVSLLVLLVLIRSAAGGAGSEAQEWAELAFLIIALIYFALRTGIAAIMTLLRGRS